MEAPFRYPDLVRRSFLFLIFFGALIWTCRMVNGFVFPGIVLMGLYGAYVGKTGFFVIAYFLIPLLGMTNPLIVYRGPSFYLMARLSSLVLASALIFKKGCGSSGRYRHYLPVLGVFFFMVVASISSVQGWFPLISFFKIINFSLFVLVLYLVSQDLSRRPDDMQTLRAALLALSGVIVIGSLLLLPFPAVSYLTSLSDIVVNEGMEAATDYFESGQGMGLFCGITCQSQFLGPVLACIGGWLLCDMLLVERRVVWLHALLLTMIPPMIYMTRSRAGFFAFAVMLVVVRCYCLQAACLTFRQRRHVRTLMLGFLAMLVIAVAVSEFRNHSITRLLRKTDDIMSDSRGFLEAVTASRRGLVKRCLDEFSQNPLLGSGFQVIEEHRDSYKRGEISFFSAPLEKGLLPLMVLGETGILGAVVFLCVLLGFCSRCYKCRYSATLSLFIVFLATNCAEATFFSPGGGGGVEWGITVIGGFVIDMSVIREARRKSFRDFGCRLVAPGAFGWRPVHRVHLHRIELPASLLAGKDDNPPQQEKQDRRGASRPGENPSG